MPKLIFRSYPNGWAKVEKQSQDGHTYYAVFHKRHADDTDYVLYCTYGVRRLAIARAEAIEAGMNGDTPRAYGPAYIR